MKSDMMKASQGAADRSAASWFSKDIFYALIAPTTVSRLGLALLFLAQLGLALLMLKQVSVGDVLFFWCLLSSCVSAWHIRPLLQRFSQVQTLRLQPYFYRHFYMVLGSMVLVFAVLPIIIFMMQYQAYNLISIWLVFVTYALAGMWASDDRQQMNAASLVIISIGMVSILAIWFGLLQSSETLATIVRGELPEVVLGCYSLSAIFLLSPLVSGKMDSSSRIQVPLQVRKSWLPIRPRLLLSMDNQQVMFAICASLLSSISLLIAYWLGVGYKGWGVAVMIGVGSTIGGLLPSQWNKFFQAKPELFERLAFTLAINSQQAQRQIYQTIITLFIAVVAATAVPLIIIAILSGDLLLLGMFLGICTLALWLYVLQYYFDMLGPIIVIIAMGAGSAVLFDVYHDPLLLTLAAAICLFASLGYCYFKPPKNPFGEVL